MLKKLTALLALILALLLVFSACAPPAPYEEPGPDPDDNGYELVIVSDAPTDNAPETERANSPPTTDGAEGATAPSEQKTKAAIDADGVYTNKDDVALYIHTYGRLPGNFITKKEAEALGWTGGSLERYAPGKCIGGSRFGNYEGALPDKKGRVWYECDVDTLGAKKRGAKRLVYSNDGLIYYTPDHYETFRLMYGEG